MLEIVRQKIHIHEYNMISKKDIKAIIDEEISKL